MQSFQPGDEKAMMTKMMVEQHRAQDAAFIETGHENEDFEAALLHYCQTDREVAMEMQRFMQKMRAAAPGMGM